MANISTSNITQKWADNGYWNAETDRTIYAGYATSTDINYVTRIRILMPGNGVSAQFKIAYKHDGSLNGKQLKYKITKEEQDGTYGRANASTAGDGTLTIAASSGYFTINYTGSFTSGSYLYIYLWTGGSTSVYTLCNILGPSNHTATYTEGTASDCSISGSTIGSAVSFTISADNSSFTHTITASFGSYVYNIATKTASKSVTWTPPLADLAGLIPNGVEITGSVTCSTYNGSTFIGSNTYNLKLSLPASVVPTLDSSKVSVSPVSNNATANSWSVYVQNYSMAKATVASGAAAGVYGSTIQKTELVYAGQAFASLQTGVLTAAGNVTFTVRITDSRGRTASVSFAAYINPYIEPYLSAYTVYRCNAEGVQSNDGMYIYASAIPIWSSVNGKNSVALTAEVVNVADNSIVIFEMDAYTDIISAGLSPNSTYHVTITISDGLGNYNDGKTVLPATAVVDFAMKKGHVKQAALFKYPEREGFEVPSTIWADDFRLTDGGIVYTSKNPITPESIGALPNTWMPTAAQVGALPLAGGTMTGNIFFENDSQRNIRFNNSAHSCQIYGGSTVSTTGIGAWDVENNRAIWQYLDDTNEFVITPKVTLKNGIDGVSSSKKTNVTVAANGSIALSLADGEIAYLGYQTSLTTGTDISILVNGVEPATKSYTYAGASGNNYASNIFARGGGSYFGTFVGWIAVHGSTTEIWGQGRRGDNGAMGIVHMSWGVPNVSSISISAAGALTITKLS